jgi:Cu2+-exporting ATPase/Cu+-exporting ATPase
VAVIQVGDKVRAEAAQVVAWLKSRGMKVWLLTGDQKVVADGIALAVGIPAAQILAFQTPVEKMEFFKNHPFSLMVGDGANDALALSEAKVGMAVRGALDLSLRAAPVTSTRAGLKQIPKLFESAWRTQKLLYQTFIVAVFYNLLGVGLVFAGVIHPLLAAVLMPASSFSVLAMVLWGTRTSVDVRGAH